MQLNEVSSSNKGQKPVQLYVAEDHVTTANSAVTSTVSQATDLYFKIATIDIDALIFSILAAQWKRETHHMSSLRRIFESPPYLRILTMGADKVVPLIIKQLIKEGPRPYHWFAALSALTDANPGYPLPSNVADISRAWIEWGRARYGSELGKQ